MLTYDRNESATDITPIALLGIGGAGSNVLETLVAECLSGCSLYSVNADARLLEASSVSHKIHLGGKVTFGLGSGGDPALGAQVAKESEASLVRVLEGCKVAVIVAGLGGGTGSGASPVIARLARELGIFLVSVVTMPFAFEGARRRDQAEDALRELSLYSDAVLIFENDLMGSLLGNDASVMSAFDVSNQLMSRAIMSIPELALRPGLIHLGLDDLKLAVSGKGHRCLFGCGKAKVSLLSPESWIDDLVSQVLASPLLVDESILRDIKEVLVHIRGGRSLTLDQVQEVMAQLTTHLPLESHVHFGVAIADDLGDEVRVSLFASQSFISADRLMGRNPVVVSDVAPIKMESSETKPLSQIPEVQIITSDRDPVDDEPVISSLIGGDIEDLPEEALALVDDDVFDEELPQEKKIDDEPEFDLEVPTPVDLAGKGRFDGDVPFIVDGEDMDLPPSMRRKK
ncbi:MAG: cell division protein FtsZ [Akkermansia sp.]